MHEYSLDTNVRRDTHVKLAVLSLGLPTAVVWIVSHMGFTGPFAAPLSFGTTFAALFFLFDKYLWRLLTWVHGVPDLNGYWKATGVSSYVDPVTNQNVQYSMDVTIKQTFSKIEIFTETKDSTSRSFMASIETEHAVKCFRYAFDNVPKNMANSELQRHPGVIDLRLTSLSEMDGDYFSGKHRLRFGELHLKKE